MHTIKVARDLLENQFPHLEMIQRLREQCQQDPNLQAGMLYGSFAEGHGDRYSDIDCMLFFSEEALPQIDPRHWAGALAPLLIFYRNEFNNWAAVYENLVRVEYHFNSVRQIPELLQFRGVLHFPSKETAILLDRKGELEACLETLASPPGAHDSMVDVLILQDSLCNWLVFGSNVLARGEFVRAGEILRLVQDSLLRLARMEEDQTHHWATPSRNFERELSPLSQQEFQTCTSSGQIPDLCRAYWNSWFWGTSLLHSLASRLGGKLNESVLQRVEQHLVDLVKPGIQPAFRSEFVPDHSGNFPISAVQIRPAHLPDLPDVLELIRLLEVDGRMLNIESAQQLFARFQSYPNYTLYVAEMGGEIIGVFALLIMDNLAHLGAPSAILEDMVVKSPYQGKGVGRAMITHAMQVCRSAGCYKLVLSSSLRRADAHRFYEKLGFEQYGFCFAVNIESRADTNGAQDD